MPSRERSVAIFVSVLALLIGVLAGAADARADGGLSVARPHDAARLALDEPGSGLHLEVDGSCTRREIDRGMGASCPVLRYESEPGRLEGAAFVMGDAYSVDLVSQERGTRPANEVANELCGAAASEPTTVVTFADRRFVRARLPAGGQICFVTAEERPDVAAVLFRELDPGMLPITHPEFSLVLEREADAVMGTLRRATATPASASAPAPVRARVDSSSNPIVVVVILAGGVLLLLAFVKRGSIADVLGRGRPAAARVAPSRHDRREQVAGSKCVVCKRKIVSEKSATGCLDCEVTVHKDCLSRHVSAAHGPAPGAYR